MMLVGPRREGESDLKHAHDDVDEAHIDAPRCVGSASGRLARGCAFVRSHDNQQIGSRVPRRNHGRMPAVRVWVWVRARVRARGEGYR